MSYAGEFTSPPTGLSSPGAGVPSPTGSYFPQTSPSNADVLSQLTGQSNQQNQLLQQQIKAIQDQLAATSTVPPVTKYAPVNIDPNIFKVPDINAIITQVSKDPTLVAYYTKLINEASGDMNTAIQRLQQDYTTGVRLESQKLGQATTRTQEDLASSLKQLGITFPQEQNKLLDTLNQRGIALTQGNAAGQPLNVATEGQSGYEMGQLKQDQALRNEAVQRTAQRSLQDIALEKSQQLGDPSTGEPGQIARSQTRGTEDVQQQYRKTAEDIQTQQEQKTYQLAQIQQQQQIAQQQAAQAQASLDIQKRATGG